MNGVVAHEGHENLTDADDTIFAASTPPAPRRRSLKRAAELFPIDEWGSNCRFVEKAWRSHSEPEPAFISVAVSRWQIVVTTQRAVTKVTLRGPETRGTVTPV